MINRKQLGVARTAVFLCASLGAFLTGCGSGTPQAPPQTEKVSIIAVGDIAHCDGLFARNKPWEATARLINALSATAPVLVLGDMAYEDGSAAEFRDCFDPSWGQFLSRSYPTPGNHEYYTAQGGPYFDYYGERAGPQRRGYYSFDIGKWHLISMNSNIDMKIGSAQYQWLQSDLDANKNTLCTLAFWHEPRFGSAVGRVVDPNQADVWRLLYAYKTELILNSDEHMYERFGPLDGDGVPDKIRGVRQFILGTGGADPYSFALRADANSERRIQGAYGVATFNLLDNRYEYSFVDSSNQNSLDVGGEPCF